MDKLTLETNDPLLYEHIRSEFHEVTQPRVVRILGEDWVVVRIDITDNSTIHDSVTPRVIEHGIVTYRLEMQRLLLINMPENDSHKGRKRIIDLGN